MNSELVEAVARVIDPASWADDLPIPTRAHTIAFHTGRALSAKLARAVIPVVMERLREPTPAMLDAGESGLANAGVDDPNKVDACECWQAMIDAAIRGLGA